MNIVKSLHASLLYRTWSHQDRHYFTVSALWCFDITNGEALLEQSLWQKITEALSDNELFDTGMPKPRAEFLIYGQAYAPDQQPVKAIDVQAKVGEISKTLRVFGDRHWISGLGVWGLSEPEPFIQMPITYAHAFGGKNDSNNPIGMGLDEIKNDAQSFIALPNIEYPQQLITAPADRPTAASFNRIDLQSQQRLQYAGTYDQTYIETRMPALPDDFDYRFFNDAAGDQQQADYFQGDECYCFENMHPNHPVIKGQLPAVTARLFVNQQVDKQLEFKEINSHLDTLWFFPDQQLGVMIHRGTIEVGEDDACDIKQLLIAHESLSQTARSIEHYQQQCQLRTDPEQAYQYMLTTQALIPQGETCGFARLSEQADLPYDMLARGNIDQFMQNQQQQARQQSLQQVKQCQTSSQLDVGEQEKLQQLQQQLDKNFVEAKTQTDQLPDEMQNINDLIDKMLPELQSGSDSIDLSQCDFSVVEQLNSAMQNLQQRKNDPSPTTTNRSNRLFKQLAAR